jgi:hypothetical protein
MTAHFAPNIPNTTITIARDLTRFAGTPFFIISEEIVLVYSSVGLWYKAQHTEKIEFLPSDEASAALEWNHLRSPSGQRKKRLYLVISDGKDLKWEIRSDRCGYEDEKCAEADFEKIISTLAQDGAIPPEIPETLTIRVLDYDQHSRSYWLSVVDAVGNVIAKDIEWHSTRLLRELLMPTRFTALSIECDNPNLREQVLSEPNLG